MMYDPITGRRRGPMRTFEIGAVKPWSEIFWDQTRDDSEETFKVRAHSSTEAKRKWSKSLGKKRRNWVFAWMANDEGEES